MTKVVFVKGNVLITACEHEFENFVMGATEEYLNEQYPDAEVEIINGDLFIDDYYKTCKNVIYAATGGITLIIREDGFQDVIQIKQIYDRGIENIKDVVSLIEKNETIKYRPVESTIYMQLYIGVFGAMEALLSDLFLFYILKKEEYKISFLKKRSAKKIDISEIFQYHRNIDDYIKKEVQEISFHNLENVYSLYNETFSVNFPQIKSLYLAKEIRHDLVHRNGRTKKGGMVIINKDRLYELIQHANDLVDKLTDVMKDLNTSDLYANNDTLN